MLLTWTIFMPLLGAVALGIAAAFTQSTGERAFRDKMFRAGALAVALITFALSLNFVAEDAQASSTWIVGIGASFKLRIDGISAWLFVLTTFLTPIGILVSWHSISIPGDGGRHRDDHEGEVKERGVAGFLISLLLLETAMLGAFVAYDLLLFFVFWELMLIPMYFLIGIWGSPGMRNSLLFGQLPERIYATIKFVLYTMAGSALMLVGIFALRAITGTFDLERITEYAATVGIPEHAQFWLFWAFFIAFAIKVPLFPFHTWLPDAHTQAPTAGSVILAGVLLKMGTYGIIRFCLPLFPDAASFYAEFVSLLAVIGIIYGALVAMVQPDMKRLVAFSSVSHLGFIVLGLFSGTNIGVQGAVMQMVNHGISTSALFILVGMLYERRHTRAIADFGGIAKSMPVYAVFFVIITLSSIGLPGTNGFVGEFMVLLGAFMTEGRTVYAVVAASGVVLAAVYMLWMVQRVFHGPLRSPENERLTDLSAREVAILVPLVVLVFLIGLFPKPFLSRMDNAGAITNLRKAGTTKERPLNAKVHLSRVPEYGHE